MATTEWPAPQISASASNTPKGGVVGGMGVDVVVGVGVDVEVEKLIEGIDKGSEAIAMGVDEEE